MGSEPVSDKAGDRHKGENKGESGLELRECVSVSEDVIIVVIPMKVVSQVRGGDVPIPIDSVCGGATVRGR